MLIDPERRRTMNVPEIQEELKKVEENIKWGRQTVKQQPGVLKKWLLRKIGLLRDYHAQIKNSGNLDKGNIKSELTQCEKEWIEMHKQKFNFGNIPAGMIVVPTAEIERTVSSSTRGEVLHRLSQTEVLLPENLSGSFLDLFSVSLIDDVGNSYPSDKNLTQLATYGLEFELKLLEFEAIFYEAIRQGKLFVGDFITYVSPNTDWAELLTPSIQGYFMQLEFWLRHASTPNIIPYVDSVVLKIEGLLREICDLNEIVTQKLRGDARIRTSLLPKLLEELEDKNILSKNDQAFFKYVLLPGGLNLRNAVAHALLREYSLRHMNILILVLFRLSKYFGTV